jgi:putative heme transporter
VASVSDDAGGRHVRRGSPPAVSRSLWPVARLGLNVVLAAAGLAIVGYVAVQVRLVVLPLLLALLLSTLLVGPADALRRRGVPSAAAALVVMLTGLGLLVGVLVGIIPLIVAEFDDVGRSARQGLDEALRWLSQGPLGVDRDDVTRAVDRAIDTVAGSGNLAGSLVSGATLLIEVVAGLLLMLVILFFFVHDGRRMWSWTVGLLPVVPREAADAIGRRMWRTVSGYVRGVAIVAFVDAVLIGIALLIIGVPLVLPLAVLTFLGAFVPLAGAVVAGAVAALVALVTEGVVAAILVVIVITVIQQLEGDLLYPVVVGRSIALHPVAILLALTAGAVLAGLVGALLAVPVSAMAWDVFDYLRSRSPAYATDDWPPDEPPEEPPDEASRQVPDGARGDPASRASR